MSASKDTAPSLIEPPELNVRLDLEDVRQSPKRRRLQPEPAVLSEIAAFLSVDELSKLNVDLEAVALPGRRFAVRGPLHASYRQTCVVSLQPMAQKLSIEVDRVFQLGEIKEDLDADPDAQEIDPLEEDYLDLGALVLEELSLNVDPHPMLKDATPPKHKAQGNDSPEKSSPFAVLEALKTTKE